MNTRRVMLFGFPLKLDGINYRRMPSNLQSADLSTIIKLCQEGSVDFISNYALCQTLSEKLGHELN